MSVVIAVKDRDGFVLGADKQTSFGGKKTHNCTKIWEDPNYPGLILGSVGYMAISQMIQYGNIIDKNFLDGELTTSDVYNHIRQAMKKVLKDSGVKVEDPDDIIPQMHNSFLIAYKNKAWEISGDFCVSEIDDYYAIGSGAEIAQGVLFATKNLKAEDRIKMCIEAASQETLYVDSNVDILRTSTKKSR